VAMIAAWPDVVMIILGVAEASAVAATLGVILRLRGAMASTSGQLRPGHRSGGRPSDAVATSTAS
jgi:hypothetical protein